MTGCRWWSPIRCLKTAVFFLGNQLYRYERSLLGPFYNATLHSTHNFAAGPANYLTALTFATTDPQRAYAVNDAAQIFLSTDHGVTWSAQGGGAPIQHYFYGNAIAAHPIDPLECVIGGSGYSAAGVIRTTDGGNTWSPLINGLPPTHLYDLAYAENGTGDLYAAAESGAYWYDRSSNTWNDILGAMAPLTTYWSVEAVPDDGLMRFGTYGRGIWDYRLPETCAGYADNYGIACPGSGGFWPLLEVGGCPSPGEAVSVTVSQALGGGSATFLFGFNQAFTPLPNGCLLMVSPLLPLSFTVPLLGSGPGNGQFQINTTLPGDAATGTLTMQALIADPGANGGYVVTNGVSLTVQ